MERTIPHIRNIFSNTSSRKKSCSDTQDLCQYDKSPRSRRKPKDPPVDYYEYERLDKPAKTPTSSKKSLFDVGKENQHQKTKDKSKEDSSRKSRNYNTYTSKTLTERDMRHLERHLSMKKTIRKQISRNLAQAFLDNPDIFEPDDCRNEHRNDHKIPVSAASEQNVLDLLKISVDDRDSGHSSPSLEDTEDDEEVGEVRGWRSSNHRGSETRGLVDDRPKHQESDKKTSSIWKMFSSRGKDKR